MPYINREARVRLDDEEDAGYVRPKTAGELNYVFTVLAHDYWLRSGMGYQAFNDIIGALEGCKLELYRRKVVPYEDGKIKENGDVG